MRILGLGTEGDSGAAVVENGRILAAVNEERVSRLKLVEGFPRGSLATVLDLSNTATEELDLVLVGGTKELFAGELRPFKGWFAHWEGAGVGARIKRAAGKASRYRNRLPFLEPAYYALLAPSFWRRRRGVERILRREFDIRCPVGFVDHHTAHAAAAYASSGYREALIVTLDGGGDGLSGMVATVRGGRLQVLHRVSAYNSLGNYYAYASYLCGFQAMKHEGKVTGLAAHGEPCYVDLLQQFIDYEDGTLVNRGGVVFTEAVRELRRRLPPAFTPEDLAASIQAHSEDLVRRFVRYWTERTGLRSVALGGGLFGNVRINEQVHRLPSVDRIHIHPHMGDGGMGVGAAMAAVFPGVTVRTMPHRPEPLPDALLGTDITADAAEAALRRHGLSSDPVRGEIADHVADLLAEGYVVGRAAGPMEYGPRALGSRSLLYHPTDPSVNDWLNRNLHRTEFMPFAPAVLAEAATRCFEHVQGAEHAAEFMTITFQCTTWMRRHMPGVVHLDGTARTQLVPANTRNRGYREILEAFQRRTGLPGLINTSFNMHEEPIVATADDAVRAFLAGRIDYLIVGPHLVAHPQRARRPLQPVAPADRARASA
jgi:carbamoyltransferase